MIHLANLQVQSVGLVSLEFEKYGRREAITNGRYSGSTSWIKRVMLRQVSSSMIHYDRATDFRLNLRSENERGRTTR